MTIYILFTRQQVAGFDELVRLYVLKAVSQSYKLISLEKLAAYLGVEISVATHFIATYPAAIDKARQYIYTYIVVCMYMLCVKTN